MLFILLILNLIFPPKLFAYLDTKSVNVSAAIDENRVTINGYTSPGCRVELSSTKAFAITYSDDTGYFIFDKTILPKNPSELCLSAIDDNHRRSTPVCIPPPPATNYHTDIGPIILPPTLTIDSDQIKPNSTTSASGQSIPNSPINIYLYQNNPNAPSFPSLGVALAKFRPKSVQAFGLPVFTTTSDSNGNYNFTLPTAYSSHYRLYSTVLYQDNFSPKSNTLNYTLPSLFWLFWQQNSWLIIALPIFVLTLSLFFYLIYIYYLHPKKPVRFLPALFSYPLSLPPPSKIV